MVAMDKKPTMAKSVENHFPLLQLQLSVQHISFLMVDPSRFILAVLLQYVQKPKKFAQKCKNNEN